MYCNKCGNKVNPNQRFCNKCGNKLIFNKTDDEINYETNDTTIENNKNSSNQSNKGNKSISISVLMVILIVLVIIILIFSIITKKGQDYYFSENNEIKNEVEISPSVQSNSNTTQKSGKYSTAIITDNVYSGISNTG